MSRALEGRRILITRSPHQSDQLRELLTELGAEVVAVPTIEIRPRPSFEIDPVASQVATWDWLVFTSANAVRFFLERCRTLGTLSELLADSGPQVCAVGPATSGAIQSFGVRVALIPESFQAEGVVEAFRSLEGTRGTRILLPIASRARDVLALGLRRMGADVTVLPTYDTVPPQEAPRLLRAGLARGHPDLIVFTSSSTARNFVAICSPDIDPGRFRFAVIGSVTADTCGALGIHPVVEARTSTVPGLAEAIQDYFKNSG